MRKCPSQRPRARARTHRSSDVEAVLPTRQLVEDERLASAVQAGDGDHRDGPAHVGELGAHGIVDAEPAPRRVPPAPAPVRVSDGGACVRARSYAAHLDFLSETGPSRPMKSAGASTPMLLTPLSCPSFPWPLQRLVGISQPFCLSFAAQRSSLVHSSAQLSRSQLSSAFCLSLSLFKLTMRRGCTTRGVCRHVRRGCNRPAWGARNSEDRRGPVAWMQPAGTVQAPRRGTDQHRVQEHRSASSTHTSTTQASVPDGSTHAAGWPTARSPSQAHTRRPGMLSVAHTRWHATRFLRRGGGSGGKHKQWADVY